MTEAQPGGSTELLGPTLSKPLLSLHSFSWKAFTKPGSRGRGLGSLIVAIAVLGLAACASNGASNDVGHGPLAIVDVAGGAEALGGTGPIHIGDNCVTMEQPNGNSLLLVWHLAQGGWEVGWNDDKRDITFSGPAQPEPVTIGDGDIITVGGETWEPQDAPVTRNFEWVAAPDESCTGELFAVSSVTIGS
jgi:hypothetical protein